ncbi:hypothetical protein [Streptosporangium subroseum]|uniref:hypothetical protein n=1 Tax=Streptosporangium subroseum TaxID=106412 RepID=UPI00308E4D0C|nr:hypothetical protein OHB15_02335 [Streptosporangium subroseum]
MREVREQHLEPVVAAWLLLGGTLSALQLVGGAVVLAGAVWGILATPARGAAPAEEKATPAASSSAAGSSSDVRHNAHPSAE